MGKHSQQQRSRRRMTLYNKAKSAEKVQAKDREIQILKLEISEVVNENSKLQRVEALSIEDFKTWE